MVSKWFALYTTSEYGYCVLCTVFPIRLSRSLSCRLYHMSITSQLYWNHHLPLGRRWARIAQRVAHDNGRGTSYPLGLGRSCQRRHPRIDESPWSLLSRPAGVWRVYRRRAPVSWFLVLRVQAVHSHGVEARVHALQVQRMPPLHGSSATSDFEHCHASQRAGMCMHIHSLRPGSSLSQTWQSEGEC